MDKHHLRRGDEYRPRPERRRGLKLQPDDLEPGLLVTILRGAPCRVPANNYLGWTRGETAAALKGHALEVLGVSLPYVMTMRLEDQLRFVLDIRDLDFCRITPEFAACFRPQLVAPPNAMCAEAPRADAPRLASADAPAAAEAATDVPAIDLHEPVPGTRIACGEETTRGEPVEGDGHGRPQ